MKYTIGVAGKNFEYESDLIDRMEIATRCLDEATEPFSLGLLVSVSGEEDIEDDIVYINTCALLANMGCYDEARELEKIIDEIIKSNEDDRNK